MAFPIWPRNGSNAGTSTNSVPSAAAIAAARAGLLSSAARISGAVSSIPRSRACSRAPASVG